MFSGAPVSTEKSEYSPENICMVLGISIVLNKHFLEDLHFILVQLWKIVFLFLFHDLKHLGNSKAPISL